MASHFRTGFERVCSLLVRQPTAAPLGLCIGLLLVFSVNQACAAALGNLATSVGLFAALAALLVAKSWSAGLPAATLSTAGGALLIAGGAAWLWRMSAAASGGALRPFGTPRNDARSAGGRPGRDTCVALPLGLERDALLAELRLHFLRLHEAWDLGSMAALQGLTTPEMLAEFCLDRPGWIGAAASRTDVVTLQAELFAFEELDGAALVASVEFSGLMRHAPGEAAAPFRELWILMRPRHDASGWRLARHQALL